MNNEISYAIICLAGKFSPRAPMQFKDDLASMQAGIRIIDCMSKHACYL